jgi:hypothetical protein
MPRFSDLLDIVSQLIDETLVVEPAARDQLSISRQACGISEAVRWS